MELNYDINGGDFGKAGYASSEIKKILKQLNLDVPVIKRIAVALYEAEVNIVAHAYEGQLKVNINPDKITVIANDKGPGIPNIDQAMEEGYSTASDAVREMGFGAGMGLPNIKKNTDQLNLKSKVGQGTTLEFSIYLT